MHAGERGEHERGRGGGGKESNSNASAAQNRETLTRASCVRIDTVNGKARGSVTTFADWLSATS